MAAIKNFRRDCYQGLTSAAESVHRIAEQKSLTTEEPEDPRGEIELKFYSLFPGASAVEKL
jgi:hypothetical protein